MVARLAACLGLIVGGWPSAASADEPPLAEYFRSETARIEARPLAGIDSADAWKARRPELRRALLEMLGLWPEPERGDLEARITGTVDRPEFTVEKLVFRSLPGLYVTGNLYRPKQVDAPLPAILYVCGHAKVEDDGVIFGNKAHYQHHAEWYAANGYVCLVVDTLQLGEVPGLHHGTYRDGLWWWYSRGYTPAGVEAWNGVRALDYLVSRPEVDPRRLGVTGRSGGGATSWWLGAIDDRLSVVVPVAGITDLRDHVCGGDFPGPHTNGVVEGHCDCMYVVNTHRWDYDTIAALVAPKALLVENTDSDPIFPEGGVRRIHDRLRTVYDWYDAADRLGLVVGRGGHVDSGEIRHASFAFMDRWLRDRETDPASIDEPDRKIPPEELKVLEPRETPAGSRNATIHRDFVARADPPAVPDSASAWEELRGRWLERLRRQVFAGWPSDEEAGPLLVERAYDVTRVGVGLRAFDFRSQPGVTLRVWLFHDPEARAVERTTLVVLDEPTWKDHESLIRAFEAEGGDPSGEPRLATIRRLLDGGTMIALVAPRGVGPTAWPADRDTHLRRRFYLLGQTLDGMRAWDVRRALRVVRGERPTWLLGAGPSAPVALWAAVFEPEVEALLLVDPPSDAEQGPAFLNLSRILDMPQAVALLAPRTVRLWTRAPEAWAWARSLDRLLDPDRDWLTIAPWAPALAP